MNVISTHIKDVLILQPKVHSDNRGFFLESFNSRAFAEETGLDVDFVQDNHSRSTQGTLRGLHYQLQQPQGKLIQVIRGCIFDVALDLRRSSETYGQHLGIALDASEHRQLWIPPGFAHGFLVLSESVDLLYKTTDYYHPASEHTVKWDAPELGIDWPLAGIDGPPILSDKDRVAAALDPLCVFD